MCFGEHVPDEMDLILVDVCECTSDIVLVSYRDVADGVAINDELYVSPHILMSREEGTDPQVPQEYGKL